MNRPRHAFDARVDTDADSEAPRAPGLAALLRRNPQLKRNAALGSIVAGVAVFTAASLTSSFAAADTHAGGTRAHGAADTHASSSDLGALLTLADSGSGNSGTATRMKTLTGKPVHVKKPAPATKPVINALAANGIPKMALNAYRVAAKRIDNVDPGCGLSWTLLAGIGRVESDHGRFGGAVFNADGTTTPHIIGPALDGVHWDYVPAPANGKQLDGDAVYAHALGPMQFIPQTWAAYGADANGDGVADVFNINDAALGAARYLCAAGGDLRTRAGQTQAVLTYNHSDQYLAEVLALADAYRRGVNVSGIPLVGNTSGSLSPVRTTNVPPANPGDPTALQPKKSKKKSTSSGRGGKKTTAPKAGASAGSTTGTKRAGAGSSSTSAGSTGTVAAPPPSSSSSSPGNPVKLPTTLPTSLPTTLPAPSTTSAPPPATSAAPSPSPTPTKTCVIPDPFDTSKCWL